MRKLIVLIIASLILFSLPHNTDTSANEPERFESYASKFYAQMMTDGKVTEKVESMHGGMKEYHCEFKDEELYRELNAMYNALNTEGISATPHQLNVMRLINEGIGAN